MSSTLFPVRVVRRAGMTLVEILVGMTCMLLLMFAITQTFKDIGDLTSKGRAAIEMSTQLRGVQHRLHKDLESLTVPVRPWPMAGSGEGYAEFGEGMANDMTNVSTPAASIYGDYDDWIAMTIRSTGEPFVGRYLDPSTSTVTMVQSQVAEVIWFPSYVDADLSGTFTAGDSINLHRRVLLIRPDLNNANTGNLGIADSQLSNFLQNNDISVRRTGGGGNLVANNLSDLTQRQARFPLGSDIAAGVAGATLPVSMSSAYVLTGARTGEDLMLSNMVAIDLRVFDRLAAVKASASGTEGVTPGDPGYPVGAAGTTIGYGAYVDLYYSRNQAGTSEFSGAAANLSGLSGSPAAIYDTWSYAYEHDGINQDGDSVTDEATNGLDDDNVNGVDDVGERETSPPYPIPLRGIQVRLRVLEPETRQVRQATVTQDFIPE